MLEVVKGTLSRYFALFENAEIRPQINGYSKIGMKFVYQRPNNYTETLYCSLLLRMLSMEMDYILKNLASVFHSSRTSF